MILRLVVRLLMMSLMVVRGLVMVRGLVILMLVLPVPPGMLININLCHHLRATYEELECAEDCWW